MECDLRKVASTQHTCIEILIFSQEGRVMIPAI